MNFAIRSLMILLPFLGLGYCQNDGMAKNMFDAMQQLMTGDDEFFDPEFYETLQSCFDIIRPDLKASQDAAWAGMVRYFDEDGCGTQDTWGEWEPKCVEVGFCEHYHEQNLTAQEFHSIEIYEPCNYASNYAYYHDTTEICNHMGSFSMPDEPVLALGQMFSNLAFGSSFWHGSHTFLGFRCDNRFIEVLSYIMHQASVMNLDTDSPIINDLSYDPRPQTSIDIANDITTMFLDQPVEEWTMKVMSFDMPRYYLSFAGIVTNVFTLAYPDNLVDLLVPILEELFGMRPQEIEFINDHYIPEIRNATASLDLTFAEKSELRGNFESTLIKLLFAFLWQEQVITDAPIIFNETFNAWGAEMLSEVNAFANSLNTYEFYETNFQDCSMIYPGDEWCNPIEPHSKWHVESAVGLLDLVYLTDNLYRVTATAKERRNNL